MTNLIYLLIIIIFFILFVGYPLLIYFLSHIQRREWQKDEIIPNVMMIVPTYNEQHVIEKKILDCFSLKYPENKLKIIFVDSASSDGTVDCIRKYMSSGRIELISEPVRKGKSSALNLALGRKKGEITVLTDADAFLEPNALKKIVENFADENVGAVTSRLIYDYNGFFGSTVNVFFDLFKDKVKHLEAKLDSASYAPGEFLAFRSELVSYIEPNCICDDYYILLSVRSRGYRVVSDPEALVYELPPQHINKEIMHRRRNMTGTLLEASRFKNMIFNPKYGFFGMLIFPFYLIRLLLLPIFAILMIGISPFIVFDVSTNLISITPISIIFWSLLASALLLSIFKPKILLGLLYCPVLAIALMLGTYDFLTGNINPAWPKLKN